MDVLMCGSRQAAKALSSVRGQPIDSDYIQDELAEIIANYEYEQQVIPQTSYIGGWTNCFKGSVFQGGTNSRRTTVGTYFPSLHKTKLI